MKSNSLSFTEANNISIVDYLSSLGFEPTRIRGIDYWYYSPFREERTPSFKVNINRNVWYDHGMGEGGGILNLGAKLNQCTLSEFLEKLATGQHGISIQRHVPLAAKPETRLEVLSINEIANVNLIHYLHTRGIDTNTAKQYCKEIEFRIGPKIYDAVGFPNRSGAYELRNRWFKGSSAPKDISHIKNNSSTLAVVEGFMDFLSLLKINDGEIEFLTRESDFLILNTLRLLDRSYPVLQSYSQVNLFLDNDAAAREAMKRLKDAGMRFNDASPLYASHKDVNEFLIGSINKKENENQLIRQHRRKGGKKV